MSFRICTCLDRNAADSSIRKWSEVGRETGGPLISLACIVSSSGAERSIQERKVEPSLPREHSGSARGQSAADAERSIQERKERLEMKKMERSLSSSRTGGRELGEEEAEGAHQTVEGDGGIRVRVPIGGGAADHVLCPVYGDVQSPPFEGSFVSEGSHQSGDEFLNGARSSRRSMALTAKFRKAEEDDPAAFGLPVEEPVPPGMPLKVRV